MSPRARRIAALAVLGTLGVVVAAWLDGRAPGIVTDVTTSPGGSAPPAARERADSAPATGAPATTGSGQASAAAVPTVTPDPSSQDPVARGAYLALAGNCAGCHTARGGAPYAGGRPVATPFGTIHASNLTPDPETGLGAWSAADFRRALHEGRSRDGRALYPAFPYPDYTRVTPEDADALFAYLRSLPPVRAPNAPHALRFPWNLPLLLDAWRLLYFRPQPFASDASRDDAWNRGAYLVTALGHCGACHTARDALGGPTGPALGGGALGALGWHAPSLLDDREGGVRTWSHDETVAWLAAGVSDRAVATGPMSQVVSASLQHLTRDDLSAMAAYLRALPPATAEASARRAARQEAGGAARELGERLYRERCEDCHGADGEGAPPHWPRLAGNRTVTAASPVNAIRAVLHGGFAPATRDNPRPYGMPPFGPDLDDRQVAAIVSWMRSTWGHAAGAVEPREVTPLRPVPVE
jgi:mono/diheme cytochrome c family protein